jgi:hypothetical protein
MPGVRATATRHASGGCRRDARVCGGARRSGQGGKGERGRLRSPVAEWAARAGWPVTRASEASSKGKKGKGRDG